MLGIVVLPLQLHGMVRVQHRLLKNFFVKVVFQVLGVLPVFVSSGQPKFESEAVQSEVLLFLVKAHSGDGLLAVGHVSGDHVKYHSLPDFLQVLCGVLLDLESPLASLLVGFVFPHWFDAGLEHLHTRDDILDFLFWVIGVSLETVVLVVIRVVQNFPNHRVRDRFPSLEKADEVVEPSNSAHLLVPCQLVLFVHHFDILPDGPLKVVE